jgi:hypothetical protein
MIDELQNRELEDVLMYKTSTPKEPSEVPSGNDYGALANQCRFILSNEERLHQATGLSRAEFDRWSSEVLPVLATLNQRGEPRVKGREVGGKVVADEGVVKDEHQFLLFLVFLFCYPKWSNMAREFHVHERTLAQYVHRVQEAFFQLVDDKYQMHWPNKSDVRKLKEQWLRTLSQFNPQWRDVVFVVDGTEYRMRRSNKADDRMCHEDDPVAYSGKKRQYSVASLIVVLLNGIIAFASDPSNDVADQTLWNKLGLRNLFIGPPTRNRAGIMGDSGFYFNPAEAVEQRGRIDGHTPVSMPKGRSKKGVPAPTRAQVFTDDVKEQNAYLSKFRVVVENTIGQLKAWDVPSSKYRNSMRGKGPVTFAKLHRIIVTMVNERLKLRPLRKEGWVPPKYEPSTK